MLSHYTGLSLADQLAGLSFLFAANKRPFDGKEYCNNRASDSHTHEVKKQAMVVESARSAWSALGVLLRTVTTADYG